jgi:pyruvate,water dikinase
MRANNTSMLIEIARKRGQYLPDVSFGTHFFQDLVESRIRYLPLYPDEDDVVFNERFLRAAPNLLAEMVPEGEEHPKSERKERSTTSATAAEPYWRWRYEMAERIASDTDAERFGVQAMYLIGSTRNATAGRGSDVDLLVHFRGSDDQRPSERVRSNTIDESKSPALFPPKRP